MLASLFSEITSKWKDVSGENYFLKEADPLLEGLSPSLYEQEVMKIVSLCTMTERHLGVPINLGFPSDGNCLCCKERY